MPLDDPQTELLPPATEEELDRYEALIDGWLRAAFDENPIMVALDRGEPGDRRWYVRLAGEEKDHTTVWLRLGQRALHAEAYMMPAPEENHGRVYEQLLRRNRGTHGVWFAIGVEDAIFLVGQVELACLSEGQLDRLIGSIYAYVEQCFRPALRLGFASRLSS
ncbi:MAG TPA: YbjN domain-containing protein [Acidimicrobiales bacterium]|nr:YbjN domain-containing protein [Acidimicrobiales bacterium]